jgi:O-antigen/teichoic acid export membrane protein
VEHIWGLSPQSHQSNEVALNIESSLKNRYLAKLATNIVGLIIGVGITSIIVRALGPADYGKFEFVTSFFQQLIPIFTLATSLGFYTKLSMRPNESTIITFYGFFLICAMITMLMVVGIIIYFDFSAYVWPHVNVQYIIMGALYIVFTVFITYIGQIADAHGITIPIEISKVIQKVIAISVLLIFYLYSNLTLTRYFLITYFNFLLLIAMSISVFFILRDKIFYPARLTIPRVTAYLQEFYKYCHPLLMSAVVTVFVGLFDRWILQKYGGNIQQGFFGLAFRIGAICFIFTSAMTTLIMRELSISFQNKDIGAARRLYRRYIPMLFSIAAILSCFVVINGESIVFLFGGSEYVGATIPIIIMAFYPIHQTYGQLSGSVLYASGKTKYIRNIAVIFGIIGIGVTFILIAPEQAHGFNLGATGLAIKYVLVQFIAINVQLLLISKILKINFFKYLGHQIISISTFLLASSISKLAIVFLPISEAPLIQLLLSGMLYLLIIGLILLMFPVIGGLTKTDVKKVLNMLSVK